MDLTQISEANLRKGFKVLNRFMILMWRLGFGQYFNGQTFAGYILVIKHTGRKSGLERLTPVNFTIVEDEIYCLAAFGESADWYRNIQKNPNVEVWLPDSRWIAVAEDISDAKNRLEIARGILVASGFAAPAFGILPDEVTDEKLAELVGNYRLVRIRRTGPLTGPGGAGDLAWIWPYTTLALLVLLLLRPRKRR